MRIDGDIAVAEFKMHVRVIFGLVCGAVLLTPLAPFLWKERSAWLAYLAPLVLYARTSGEIFATSNHPGSVSNDVLRFANDLIHRGGDLAARRVSVAAGGYLAFIGSCLLAWRGIRGYRSHGVS
jgi:hypothetical protein